MKMLIHEQIIHGVVHDIHLSEPEIFCDREKEGRSGHVGHGLSEIAPGKIIDFSPNTSAKRCGGHSGFGYMEYRFSEDYGKTFSAPRTFPFSWDALMEGLFIVGVEKVVTAPDGSITAFCVRGSTEREICYEPYLTPYYVRSEDGGETWGEPREFSPYRGRIYDAILKDGVIYVLQCCGKEFLGEAYRFYKSTDCGKTFEEVSKLPIGDGGKNGYGNLIENPDGSITAYLYNVEDQYNMDTVKTFDGGKTWKKPELSYVANKIRNPQVMILDGQYILHGRAGENEAGSGAFVFYTSADGMHWDEGTILVDGRPACFYSNNLVIACPDGKRRALVEYSENYRDPLPGVWCGTCNQMHLWIETIEKE